MEEGKQGMRVGLVGACNPWRLRDLLVMPEGEDVPVAEPGVPIELLAEALIGAGHQVIIYTLDEGCSAPRRLAGPNLVIRLGPYRSRHRMRDLFAAERASLEQAIRAEPPDVLHAHWGYENALAAFAAQAAPVLVTLHDWAPAILRWQPTAYRLGRLVMYLWVLARAGTLVAPSPYIAGRLRRWFRRDSHLVLAGLPGAHVAPQPRRFPAGPPVLVAANQGFSRFKNVSTLLAAFPAIRAACPGARLRLLGHGHEPEGAAQAWARSHGLTEGVEFVGQVPAAEVARQFATAHLMVHPSREEAFGHVLIEAMAQGVPVVANRDAEAPAWLLGEGAQGVLVPCRDPEPLAAACIALLNDPARWEALSRAGWERVGRDFSVPAMTRGYEALYRRLLAPGQGVAQHQP